MYQLHIQIMMVFYIKFVYKVWNMFKTRKVNFAGIVNSSSVQKQQSKRSQTTKRGITPPKLSLTKANNKQKWNEYSLYAKSLLLQINQDMQSKILTSFKFKEKKNQIFNVIRKCGSQAKFSILIELVSISGKLKAKLQEQNYEDILQMIGFICKLTENDDKKLYQFIIVQKIYETLLYILKSYPKQEGELIQKMKPLIKRINSARDKLNKVLCSQEYHNYIASLTVLSIAQSKHHKRLDQAQPNIQKQKQSGLNMSRDSFISEVSQTSEQYRQKLNRLSNAQQSLQILKKLNPHMRANKKQQRRSGARFGSIKVNNSSRRVSSMWGRQQNSQIESTDLIKKNQNSVNTSKFSNANILRKSISVLKNSQSIIPITLLESLNLNKNNNSINQWFAPFYFYTIIKGIIRINYVNFAKILEDSMSIKIILGGYFTRTMILFRLSSQFVQNIDVQKLRRFLMNNLQLKQKSIWNVLTLKSKIQNQSSQNLHRNLISELLLNDDKYIFYSFVKRLNVYFFVKYQSTNAYNKQGTVTIYDPLFQNKLQQLKLNNWSEKSAIRFQQQQQCQQQQNHKVTKYNKQINVSETNYRIEQKKHKIVKKKKSKNSINLKQVKYVKNNNINKLNTFYFVIKKQTQYVVVSEIKKENQISYSNLMFETKFRNLLSMRFSNKQQCWDNPKQKLFQHYLTSLNRKNINGQTMAILNRRIGKPEYINIRYQKTFIKKIKKLGYIICKILVFQLLQTQLILAEAYLPLNQKYYTFFLKPTTITLFLNNDCNLKLPYSLQQNLNYLIKIIKIKRVANEGKSAHQSMFKLILQIGDLTMQGKQLLFRVCQCNKNQKPLYIDSFLLENSQNQNKSSGITVRRQINKISKKLSNHIFETIKIENPLISKQNTKYSSFVKQVHEQLHNKIKEPQKLFDKIKKQYYYLSKQKNRYSIRNMNFNDEEWILQNYRFEKTSIQKQKYKFNFDNSEVILKKLNKKALKKNFKRILNDRMLFSQYLSKIQQ